MTNEEHLALMDQLTPYALGEAAHEDAARLREHLASCDTCRREYQEAREGMVMLALSAAGPSAPARSRERLLRAAGVWDEPSPLRDDARFPSSPRQRSEADDMPRDLGYAPMRRPWWNFVPALAALVLAAFAILLWVNNANLREELQTARANISDTQTRLAQAQLIAEAVTSPNTQKVTLVGAKQKLQPSLDTMYMPQKRALVLIAHDLPQVPPGKAYELWLLPANGAPPMAAGTFRPERNGAAVMTHTDMASAPEAKGFAITVESAQGSDKPTGAVVFVGL
ncbi:MAG: hypothetical protein NVS9B15_18180 [Acidobacteriaceae bacterium]